MWLLCVDKDNEAVASIMLYRGVLGEAWKRVLGMKGNARGARVLHAKSA